MHLRGQYLQPAGVGEWSLVIGVRVLLTSLIGSGSFKHRSLAATAPMFTHHWLRPCRAGQLLFFAAVLPANSLFYSPPILRHSYHTALSLLDHSRFDNRRERTPFPLYLLSSFPYRRCQW